MFYQLQYAKTGGKPGPFYHVNDASLYLGRQRRVSPIERTSLRFSVVVFVPNTGGLNVCEAKNVLLV